MIGGHFKDHVVGPNPQTLKFEIGPSVIGQGDVLLRQAWDLILKYSPRKDILTMQMELIMPSFSRNDPVITLKQSIEFLNTLPEVRIG